MPVSKAALGPLTKISEGGFGVVYRVSQYRQAKDPATPLAYKEFTQDLAEQARTAERSVLFRDLLPPDAQADLDRHAVWPRELVEDQGAVAGFVMPLIPGDFLFQLADVQTGQQKAELRDLKWLNATRKQLDANGLPAGADLVERLALLAQLVYAVARLHKHGWIFGDVSYSNAAYALDPPRMILLDCDGATSLARAAARPSVNTFGWEPPECAQLNVASCATDVYKLGLAVLRCLNPEGAGATIKDPNRLAGQLDAAGVALLARALSPDPALRPQAKELYHYLQATLQAMVTPPEILMAQLLTPVRPRGSDAHVQFAVRNVPEVTITAGRGAPVTVPVSVPGQPQVYSFPVLGSGPVVLTARNRFGVVPVTLGELEAFEMPQFDLASITGALPRFTMPDLGATPVIDVPRVPPLPPLAVGDLAGQLRAVLLPDAELASALHLPRLAGITRLPDFGTLAGAPLRAVAERMTRVAAQVAEAQRPAYLEAMTNAKDGDW